MLRVDGKQVRSRQIRVRNDRLLVAPGLAGLVTNYNFDLRGK